MTAPGLPAHMLVVEDQAPLRAQIVALLAGAGLQVDEAADGRLGGTGRVRSARTAQLLTLEA